MKLGAIPAMLLTASLTLGGCKSTSGPGNGGAVKFEPPSLEFVSRLDITAPITSDEAMAIAAEAAGGTAVGVTEEMEKGELLFEVKVETTSGRMEVEVRASDGAVVEIEPDDGD